MDYTIRVLAQAATLLRALAHRADRTVTELAKETGYTKSLVFRVLYTLEKSRLVIKDQKCRTYAIAQQPFNLADATPVQTTILRAADRFLDTLVEESKETVSIVARDGLNAIYLSVRQPPEPAKLFAQTGRRGPLHAGAGPKVMLAFAPSEVRNAVLRAPLAKYTPGTITDPERLMSVIEHVRRTEMSENYGDLDEHSFGFAAPIWDRNGTVAAALSVAGPLSRLTPDVADTLKHSIIDYAKNIGFLLGYAPGL